jgi:citrate synthase
MRTVGSSKADPYSAVSAGIAALYGPLHGGANEAVLRMLTRDRRARRTSPSSSKVREGGDKPLMGFGHRVYKNYDPRAKTIKKPGRRGVRGDRQEPAARHRAGAGADRAGGRVLHQAQAVPQRRLLLGPHLRGDGLPGDMFTGAVRHPARVALGWLAQWEELLDDKEQKIARPRQIYTGAPRAKAERRC